MELWVMSKRSEAARPQPFGATAFIVQYFQYLVLRARTNLSGFLRLRESAGQGVTPRPLTRRGAAGLLAVAPGQGRPLPDEQASPSGTAWPPRSQGGPQRERRPDRGPRRRRSREGVRGSPEEPAPTGRARTGSSAALGLRRGRLRRRARRWKPFPRRASVEARHPSDCDRRSRGG